MLFRSGSNYACEHAVSAPVTCDFKTGKIILTQAVSHEQVTKLLATGKTDLLEGFVSNRTKRKFKALLVWDENEGKVTFEFAPRLGKDGLPLPARKMPAKKAFAAKTAFAAKKAAPAGKTAARKVAAGKVAAPKATKP